MSDRDAIRPTQETLSCEGECSCNRNADKWTAHYSIEKPVSDRPLEAYAVNRIYQLEAQVKEQKDCIDYLRDALDQCTKHHQALTEILKPSIDLTTDGGIRKLNIGKAACIYCKYDRDTYYELVAHFELEGENYKACMQEYENEVRNGTDTDLSDDERCVIKTDYEARVMSEGDKHDAD